MTKKPIKLPSDKSIIDKMEKDLADMVLVMDNLAIFANVPERTREALQIAVHRAAACAKNLRGELT